MDEIDARFHAFSFVGSVILEELEGIFFRLVRNATQSAWDASVLVGVVTVSERIPFQRRDSRRVSTCVSQCGNLSNFPPKMVITLGEAFGMCGDNEVSGWFERTGFGCDWAR